MADDPPKTNFFHRATDSSKYLDKLISWKCNCQKILKVKHLWHITLTISGGPCPKLFSPISPERLDWKQKYFAWWISPIRPTTQVKMSPIWDGQYDRLVDLYSHWLLNDQALLQTATNSPVIHKQSLRKALKHVKKCPARQSTKKENCCKKNLLNQWE